MNVVRIVDLARSLSSRDFVALVQGREAQQEVLDKTIAFAYDLQVRQASGDDTRRLSSVVAGSAMRYEITKDHFDEIRQTLADLQPLLVDTLPQHLQEMCRLPSTLKKAFVAVEMAKTVKRQIPVAKPVEVSPLEKLAASVVEL